ncbi:MAG: FAD-binding protein, partial [Pseudomonadota bacterium]
GVLYPEKTSYPGVDYFLYHSDNTLISPFKEAATPAARGHRGYSPPEEAVRATGLGGPIYRPMRQKFEAEGGKTVEQSEVRQLILDRSGAVIGLKALEFIDAPEQAAKHRDLLNRASAIQAKWLPIIPGSGFFLKRAEKLIQRARDLEDTFRKPVYYRARRGVVLSAGGFIFNREMVRHYAPDFKDAFPLGTTADQGDGIRLGQTAGGAVGNMERASAWRFINPPIAWSQGVVVNMRGERFVNESAYGAKLGTDIATEQDGKAWSIVDARLAKESLAQIKSPGVLPFQRQLAQLNFRFAAKKARSIKALAQKIGIDPGALEKTVSDYNARSGSGDPDPFGKSPGDIAKLEAAPYYAINIGVSAPLFPCPTITLGGLKVNEKSGRVLDAEGAEIQGLYAAGRTAIGICSWNYLSGLSIADCVYSGRRAARHACGVNLPAEAVSD